MISKPSLHALKLLAACGINDPTEIPLITIVNGLGIYYDEKPLKNCEGRIVSYRNKTLITLKDSIHLEGKKRYALAHEIGHYAMHRESIPVILDNEENFVDWLKGGPHEQEANEFAAEFLMPREAFYNECRGKRLSPDLIKTLSQRFETSLTSTILRYVEFGNHQVCVVYCKDNKMKWWKKSKDFYPFLDFTSNTLPPVDSVAYEMFTKKDFYSDNDEKKQIWKSTWFQMGDDEADVPFFEFCLFVPSYNYSISLIWEENRKFLY